MTDLEYTKSERKTTAERLKHEAMKVAAALETIAHEDDYEKIKEAQNVLGDFIDGYHYAVKLGSRTEMRKVMARDEDS